MKIQDFDFRIVEKKNSDGQYNACDNANCVCNQPFIYGNEAFCTLSEFIDKDVEIELWSGMLDCNGIKIYEGDILNCDSFTYIVAYQRDEFVLLEPKDKLSAGNMYRFLEFDCFTYYVVGNIHENIEPLQVTLYCDGSTLGNPGAGGWCGILTFGTKQKILTGGEAHTTNNRMELLAVIESLKALKEPCVVEVYSDSSYVCNGINQWLKKWQEKQFKNIKNPDLWREYVRISATHKVQAHWVKAHAGIPQNELCDKLAKEAARQFL